MKSRTLISAALTGAAGAGIAWLATRGGSALQPAATGRAETVAGNDRVPPMVDTVVIGGGIVGCMTALLLAERGQRVALCDKGVVAGEASGRALGYVDQLFQHPDKAPLIARAKHLWEGMAERIGADSGYRRTGIAAVFADTAALDEAAGWIDWTSGAPGIDARRIDAAELARLAPDMAGRAAGAIYQPSDGIAEPRRAAPAIARRFRDLGGSLLQFCAVDAIETTGGRVSGVETERGRIGCSAVVLAGGAWSPLMAASLGLDLPQFMAFGSVLRLAGTEDPAFGAGPALIDTARNMVMRPNEAGGYDMCFGRGTVPLTWTGLANLHRLAPALKAMWRELDPALDPGVLFSDISMMRSKGRGGVSPYRRTRALAPRPHRRLLERLEREAGNAFPRLAGASPVERWAGVLTSTPDNMPVLSAAPGIDGFFVGSGFYYGMTAGPAAGEALADMVTGRAPQFDLEPYRMSRFSDGSRLHFRA